MINFESRDFFSYFLHFFFECLVLLLPENQTTVINNINYMPLTKHDNMDFGDVNKIILNLPMDSPIAKNNFHNSLRFLFIAGLEGTGHHAFAELFTMCRTLKGSLCVPNCPLSLLLSHYTTTSQSGLFVSQDVLNIASNLLQVDKLVESLQLIRHHRLVPLGLDLCPDSGLMSYPSYDRMSKPMDHPDLPMLAMLFERHHLDLRVLLLRRSAKGILNSTLRRSFGGPLEPLVLLNNADILYSQLKSIDKKFIKCVQYEELSSMGDVKMMELFSFIHPLFAENHFDLKSYFRSPSNESVNVLSANDYSYFEFMLQRKLNMLNEFC